MKKQKRHNVRFKSPKRYRLSLYNENSLNRVWTVKMGKKRLILLVIVALTAVFCAGVMLISLSPLRTFLPGYLSNSERRQLEEVDARADSLSLKLKVYEGYLSNVTSILTGDLSPDSLLTSLPADSASMPADTTSLIGRSPAESEFVKMYSERENFVLDDRQELLAEAPLFVPPVKNAIVTTGDTPGAPSIETTENITSVHSINRGIVIDQFKSPEEGYVIIIQHPDGYLSRYAGLSKAYTRKGATVDADSRIGQYAKGKGSPFLFELRRDGQPLNPLEYIPF